MSVWLVHCLCIVAMGTAVILYGFPSSNYLRRFLGYVDHTRLKFIICQGPLFLKSFFVFGVKLLFERCGKKMKTNAIARVIVYHVGNSLNKILFMADLKRRLFFMKYLNAFLIINFRSTHHCPYWFLFSFRGQQINIINGKWHVYRGR